MVRYCPGCGAAVPEGLNFCARCGAATPVPVGTVAPPVGRFPPPRPRRNPVLIVALIGGVFLLILAALALGYRYFSSYRYHEALAQRLAREAATNAAAVDTPKGAASVKVADAADAVLLATVDVPAYPGSTPTVGGGRVSGSGASGAASQDFDTADPVAKVVSFYKQKFGEQLTVEEGKDRIRLTLLTDSGLSAVTVRRDATSGATRITIAHVGE